MKLTPEQRKICKRYGRRDKEGRVHCHECPLALSAKWCVCLANVTEAEAKQWGWDGSEVPGKAQ